MTTMNLISNQDRAELLRRLVEAKEAESDQKTIATLRTVIWRLKQDDLGPVAIMHYAGLMGAEVQIRIIWGD